MFKNARSGSLNLLTPQQAPEGRHVCRNGLSDGIWYVDWRFRIGRPKFYIIRGHNLADTLAMFSLTIFLKLIGVTISA